MLPLDMDKDIFLIKKIWGEFFSGSKLEYNGRRLIWLGSGLSKIAAAYGNEICDKNSLYSKFMSPLEYSLFEKDNELLPVLITLAGKGEDAVQTAKIITKNSREAILISANPKSVCANILSENKLYNFRGYFPERDRRFVNINAIITTSLFVEKFIEESFNFSIDKNELIFDMLGEIKLKSKLIVETLSLDKNWQDKKFCILGVGYNSSVQYTWLSILSEAGIIAPMWRDLKDYTHGDHRYASLNLDHIYLLIETEETVRFGDIFYRRFSKILTVIRIKLYGDVTMKFWMNLFYAMNVANGLSYMLGYDGKRPPKNRLVDSWYGWGKI